MISRPDDPEMTGHDSPSVMGTIEVMSQLPVWVRGGVFPVVGSLSWPGFQPDLRERLSSAACNLHECMKGTYFSELFLDTLILPPSLVVMLPKLFSNAYWLLAFIESEKGCPKVGATGEVIACSMLAEPVGK